MKNLVVTLLIALLGFTTAMSQGKSESSNGNGNNVSDGNPGAPRTNVLLPFGNVGIGTLTPQQKLHVVGQSLFDGNMNVIGIAAVSLDVRVGRNLLVDGNTGLGTQTPQARLHVIDNSIFDGNIQLNGTGRVTEDIEISRDLFVDRNVGIGIRAPQAKLHLVGNSLFQGNWNLEGTGIVSNNFTIGQQFNVDGNSGFGVASPLERVEVDGNMKVSQTIFADRIEVKWFAAENGEFTNNLKIGNQFNVGGMSGFGTETPTERIDVVGNIRASESLIGSTLDVNIGDISDELVIGNRLLVNGNVGIGNTAPTQKLDVNGSVKISQKLMVAEVEAGSGNFQNQLTAGNTTINGDILVSGMISSESLNTNSITSDDISVSNNLTVSNSIDVTGLSKLKGGLDVTGNSLITGDLTVSNLLSVNELSLSTINTSGDANVGQNLIVDGVSHLRGNTTIDGKLQAGIIEASEFRSSEGGVPFNFDDAVISNTLVVGSNVEVPDNFIMAVSGNIIATGIDVKIPEKWPDYVFTDEYKLLPISEVEDYISKNGHLPGIESAQTMEEKESYSVNKMDAKLLEKIEELTLYIIEQNKQIEELREEVNALKANN